jgi:DNA-binding PadR family transcriptional regulator
VSLRHALLALLNINPQSGYDLAQRFSTSLEYVWRASHSQIYPELRRLEQEGLIKATEVGRGERATKREYGLTAAGCQAIEDWIDTVTPPPYERSVPHLRAMYLEYASFDTARRQFQVHLSHYRHVKTSWEQHLEDVRARTTNLMQLRLAQTRPQAHDAVAAYKVHMYEGLIARAEVEIAWALRGLELVDTLEKNAGLEPGERVTSPVAFYPADEVDTPQPDTGSTDA